MTHSDFLSDLSPEDRRLFYEYGLGESQSASFVSLVEAFQRHVQSDPSAIAAQYLNQSITYGELDRQSTELAARLGGLGVLPGHRVVLLVKRSISMVVGILGVLKTGSAYVPLDGGIVTDSTLTHIIKDADVKVVLTLRPFASRVENLAVAPLLLDELVPPKESDAYRPHKFSGQESAYIVYTSGTTGTPKGVDVSHRNVLNLITHSPGNLGMQPGLKVSQLLNIAFDMAQWECLGALANGCTLCLRGGDWLETLRTVDVVISTPSCLRKFTPSDFKPKAIATAGEPCPQALADRWVAGGTKFYNCCGPTEASDKSLGIHEHVVVGQKLSIGSPTPNNNVYILDENMRAVPIGTPGMIWAGGLGVAKGYLNLPERTAESFQPDVFTNNDEMMYKTGDLGQWRTDGSGLLDILGRNDDQVKVKGFRVELDGVAAAMETTPGVHTAVALLIDEEIVGVFTPDNVDEDVVRAACAKIQPYYACPSRYIKLPEMPTTSNGKTDKKKLRLIASCASSTTESTSSDVSSDSSTCPSTTSAASDEECEPHIFSSITKVTSEDADPIVWERPSTFIPTRGRLFVNVIEQEGRTFPSRSSIFTRNHTPTRSRTASEAGDSRSTHSMDNHPTNRSSPASSLRLSQLAEDKLQYTTDLRGEKMTEADELTPAKALKLAEAVASIPTPPLTESIPASPTITFDDRVLFAVPKKGRLHEKCMEMLRSTGLQFSKPNRLDICMVKNLPITLVFLPAADIPRFVGQSNIDMGITGQDVILESKMQDLTTESLTLGFGRCKLQVQVPVSSNMERIEDLAGKKVATSFESVAGDHFGKIDSQLGTKTVVEYISGSVETACALGLADGIVDLVESGETMRAAGLKPIGTIMSSEAVLISSSSPKKPHMLSVMGQLKSRLAGVVASSKYILCQYNIRRVDLPMAKKITPGRRSATVSSLDDAGWVAVSSMVEKEKAASVMDELQTVGAEDIFLLKIDNCRV
ncbi:unnamed protein product [Rhizoctonia solani]|uniref:ATP phosphoribosyltransferase n=1 Tax=Rhizoctonia solani TaxID=456999 RepID=A0A8H3CB02_9AGAM|nr:unnamed protein product [Rhizoctonia solani]